jgi:hypothetical protein
MSASFLLCLLAGDEGWSGLPIQPGHGKIDDIGDRTCKDNLQEENIEITEKQHVVNCMSTSDERRIFAIPEISSIYLISVF